MHVNVQENRNIFHGKEVSPYMGALISRHANIRSGQVSEIVTKRIEELNAMGQKRGRKNKIRSVLGLGFIFLFSLVFVYFFTNMAIEVFDITGKVDQNLNSIVNASLLDKEFDYSRCQDRCCMTSLEKITSNNYPEFNVVYGCQNGYKKNSLKCSTSLSWCEPIIVDKKKNDCASEGSLFSLRNVKKSSNDSVCCEGLSVIDSNMEDIYYCSKCGDGVCKNPETDENCAVDCKVLDTSGWKIFSNSDYKFMFLYPEDWEKEDNILVKDNLEIEISKGLSPAKDVEVKEVSINASYGPYSMLAYKKNGKEIAREYKFLQTSRHISKGLSQVENIFSIVFKGDITEKSIIEIDDIISTFKWDDKVISENYSNVNFDSCGDAEDFNKSVYWEKFINIVKNIDLYSENYILSLLSSSTLDSLKEINDFCNLDVNINHEVCSIDFNKKIKEDMFSSGCLSENKNYFVGIFGEFNSNKQSKVFFYDIKKDAVKEVMKMNEKWLSSWKNPPYKFKMQNNNNILVDGFHTEECNNISQYQYDYIENSIKLIRDCQNCDLQCEEINI